MEIELPLKATENRLAQMTDTHVSMARSSSGLLEQSEGNLSDQVNFPQNWIKVFTYCPKHLWRTGISCYSLLTITREKQEFKPLTYFIKKVCKTTVRTTIKYNYVFRQLCSLKAHIFSIQNSWVNILNHHCINYSPWQPFYCHFYKMFPKCIPLIKDHTWFNFIVTRKPIFHLFPYQLQYLLCEVPWFSVNLSPTNFAPANKVK